MIEALALAVLFFAAVIVQVLYRVGLARKSSFYGWSSYFLTLVCIGTSFYVVSADIVPKSVFSVTMVFMAVIYFAVRGYSILKSLPSR